MENLGIEQRTIEELRKMSNCGILNINLPVIYNSKGIAQSSVLAPLLFNLYLTKLDFFVDSLKIKYKKIGGKKISNTEFRSLT